VLRKAREVPGDQPGNSLARNTGATSLRLRAISATRNKRGGGRRGGAVAHLPRTNVLGNRRQAVGTEEDLPYLYGNLIRGHPMCGSPIGRVNGRARRSRWVDGKRRVLGRAVRQMQARHQSDGPAGRNSDCCDNGRAALLSPHPSGAKGKTDGAAGQLRQRGRRKTGRTEVRPGRSC
jgi:hypothetical protein